MRQVPKSGSRRSLEACLRRSAVQFHVFTSLLVVLRVADASPSEQSALLIRKLKQCCIIFDFDDPLSDVRSKEVKRLCLVELVDFVSKPSILNSEEMYMEFMHMVGIDLLLAFHRLYLFSTCFKLWS